MAFDGIVWNEAIPTNSDLAAEIDDYMRDMKLAVRSRMALEHGWGSAQTGTNNAGFHTFITLSGQTAQPVLTYGGVSTQLAVIWVSSGSKSVFISDSAGNDYVLMESGKGINFQGGVFSSTGTQGDMIIGTTGGTIKILAASAPGLGLITNTNTGNPTWEPVLRLSAGGTISGAIAVIGNNITLGATVTLTGGLLGVASSASKTVANGETFVVTAGYYVTGVTRAPDGSIEEVHYAKL